MSPALTIFEVEGILQVITCVVTFPVNFAECVDGNLKQRNCEEYNNRVRGPLFGRDDDARATENESIANPIEDPHGPRAIKLQRWHGRVTRAHSEARLSDSRRAVDGHDTAHVVALDEEGLLDRREAATRRTAETREKITLLPVHSSGAQARFDEIFSLLLR